MVAPGRIIGVDESGKGDFFGPLVVAGVLADETGAERLAAMGVKDSKKLSDNRILAIDETIRDYFIHFVYRVPPAEYNRTYQKIKNLNIMLAAGHAAVITGILKQAEASGSQVDGAISDKFGKNHRLEDALAELHCRLPIEQMIRGEAVVQVAAASIVARAEFVRQIRLMSNELGVDLPKGAAPQVDEAGRRLVQIYGPEVLTRAAKTHFKNYRRALEAERLL